MDGSVEKYLNDPSIVYWHYTYIVTHGSGYYSISRRLFSYQASDASIRA